MHVTDSGNDLVYFFSTEMTQDAFLEINIKLVLTAGIECKSSIHNLHRIKASVEWSTFSNTDIISRYRIARMQSDISRASLLKGNVTFLLESLNYSFASQSFLVAYSSRYKAPSFSFLQ